MHFRCHKCKKFVKEANLEISGNKYILRKRIRRYIETKLRHQDMLGTKFPGLSPELAQKSFEVISLLEQYRVLNTRSTVNLENPPLGDEPNLSMIIGEMEIATNWPALNTSFQITSENAGRTSRSPILAGDLGNFGQPTNTLLSQTFPGGQQTNLVWSNQAPARPGVSMAAPASQTTTLLSASEPNFLPSPQLPTTSMAG